MRSINAARFRKDIFKLSEQAIKYNEHVNVSTKEGNAVIISYEEQ